MFTPGSEVVLTAKHGEGSTFDGWTGACTGTGLCTVIVDAATNVTAAFSPQRFAVDVIKSGNGSGTVTSVPAGIDCGTACSVTEDYGTTVALTATPATGSMFTGWTGNCKGAGPCIVTVDAAKSITAEFTLQSFTISVAKTGTGIGTIVSAPPGIDCGVTCSANYEYGTLVALTATPAAGYGFGGWSGACTGTGPCSVTVDAATNVAAAFGPPQADLSVVQVGASTPVLLGETFTRTYLVSNAGPDTADAPYLDLGVITPSLVEFVSVTPAECGVDSSSTVLCHWPSLASGSSVEVQITCEARDVGTATIGGAVSPSVTSRFEDPNEGNSWFLTTTEVRRPQADLSVVQVGASTPVLLGETFTRTYRVSNAGPNTADAPYLDLGVITPSLVEFVSVTPAECGVDSSSTVLCHWPSLASGSSVEVQITYEARDVGTATTDGTVSPSVTSRFEDPNEGNNWFFTTTEVRRPQADLSVVQVGASTPVLLGETFTRTYRVSNAGPDTADAPYLWVTRPSLVDFVSVTPGECGLHSSSTMVVCYWPSLASGSSVQVQITYQARDVGTATTDGTVSPSVTSRFEDPNEGNNWFFTTTEVRRPQADLSVVQVGASTPVLLGETFTRTYRVSNAGPDTADAPYLWVTRPSLVDFVSVTPGECGLHSSSTMVVCYWPSLASGSSVQVQITYQARDVGTATTGGTVSPSVTSRFEDPNEGNNSVLTTTTVGVLTLVGNDVIVQPIAADGTPLPMTLMFHAVTTAGFSTVVPIANGPKLPSDFKINGSMYEITTTAQFTPPVTVCFTGSFGLSDWVMHFEGGVWVKLPNQQRLPAGDPPYTSLCAETQTLSPFVVGTELNNPPTADAGTDQTVETTSPSGAAVTLTGSGSDPDGDPLTFTWSGPCGTASGSTATLTCPIGASTMTLTVSDGVNPPVTDTVTITVTFTSGDTTPPRVTCGAADTIWHATDLVVACTASDDGSGLASAADASFTLTTGVVVGAETATAFTDSRTVCDAAGNCAPAGPIGPFKIDRKAPAMSITRPLDGAEIVLNERTAAGFACADAGSGVAACNGTVANGAKINTSSVGTKSFTVTGTDAVGNRASTTISYHVRFAAGGNCLWEAGHEILWPIAPNGSSHFRQGTPVPARFRVCDATGHSVGSLGVVSTFREVQKIKNGIVQEVNVDVPAVVPPPVFRWSQILRAWVFVIDTRRLADETTHVFRITLADGTAIDFRFSLRD